MLAKFLLSKMSYNIERLLYQLPQQLKVYYRKYESLYKKKINKLWALNFNKTCINDRKFINPLLIKCYLLF